ELLREQAARAEAEAGKKRIAEILERIDMAFVALDHAGRFTYVNHRMEEFLEQDATKLLGRHLAEALSGAPLKLLSAAYEHVTRDRVSLVSEEFYAERDAWLELRTYPGLDGVSVYLRDITDRRRADEA